MKCPIDGTELKMSERQGIEIDYCPKCRGVWLDRGELDKIIDRSAVDLATAEAAPAVAAASPVGGLSQPMRDTTLRNPDEELLRAKQREKERAEQLERELKLERERAKMRERERERDDDRDRDRDRSRSRSDDRYYDDDDRKYKKRKKRKSFLGEIFDFDFD